MKIMLSAGEASGDVHGENIARAILSMAPETELIGFGGSRMEEAGVRLRQNFADYSVMGVWEVLVNIRRLFKLLNDLTEFMREEKPDMLVLIDYPDFNWRLAKKAKALGIPVFSYIPPSAWAWRKGRAKDCAKIADEFIAIFPHELPVYEAAGAKISFVGNPLVDAVRAEGTSKAILMERHGAITQGKNLEEAYNRMEELEFQAKLQLLCGDVTDLPKREINKLSKM